MNIIVLGKRLESKRYTIGSIYKNKIWSLHLKDFSYKTYNKLETFFRIEDAQREIIRREASELRLSGKAYYKDLFNEFN